MCVRKVVGPPHVIAANMYVIERLNGKRWEHVSYADDIEDARYLFCFFAARDTSRKYRRRYIS